MYINFRVEYNFHKVLHKSGRLIDKKFKRIVYQFKCDSCGTEFEKSGSQISSKRRLNNNFKHFCSLCIDPAKFADLGRERYKKNLSLKVGERKIDECGYMNIYMGSTHPYSKGYGGSIREHIIVMENYLQRSLKKGEVVHHIDGNKLNNEIDNLDFCTVTQHNNCHAKSEGIIFELYKKGLVGYDRESKRYYLKT